VLKKEPEQSLAVSVVVPFHNGGLYLERLFKSLSMQQHPPAEIIFVDDCSDQNELALLREQSSSWSSETDIPVKIISLAKNQGVASARNKGWSLCQHQLIAFLDCDDAWHSEKLLRMVKCFERDSELELLGHRVVKTTEEKCPEARLEGEVRVRSIEPMQWLYRNHYVTCSSVMVRATGDFRFEESRRRSEDYALWVNYAFNGCRTGIVDEPLGCFFKLPYGFSGLSQDVWAMEKAELDVLKWLLSKKHIGLLSYLSFSTFSLLKYLRRAVSQRLR